MSTYNLSNNRNFCSLPSKKKGEEMCTYQSPTNIVPGNTLEKNYLISPLNIPFVTHIHGLEVRPAFDGNPMAWLGKDGKIGTAFQSLLKGDKYFDNNLFKNSQKSTFLPIQGIDYIYAKVNRYENVQIPGNLWYHDHAMHITQDNVGHGLVGEYIIFDPEVDSQLPSRDFDIFIMTGQRISNLTLIKAKAKVYHELQINPKNTPFFTQTNLVLMRNQTYRMRLLNGQFDAVFTNIRFKTECSVVNGEQIDPKTCRKTLKFAVIASDSALFNIPVHNVSKITLSSAERF